MTIDVVSHAGTASLNRRTVLMGGVGLAGVLTIGIGPSWAQGAPVKGGMLRVAQSADAQPKNILAGRAGNIAWRHNVFDALTVLDAETGQPRKILATDWQSSDDGKTFVIRIREDARFHTGRPLTAEDVVFTLEQVKVPENSSQMAPLVRAYRSIEATGPHEVTIKSDSPIAPRVFDVFQLAVILDKETFSGMADGSKVIGSGPFKFDEWVPGASLTMSRNDDYWGEKAHLDGIEISIITDSTALANAIRGRVDLALAVTPRDALMFQGDSSVELYEAAGGNIFPLGINVTAPPFDKKELRQAIGFAIDRERIIQQVFNGVGDGSAVWWRSNEPGTTEDLTGYYKYDLEKAKQLIAAAGAKGIDVPIRVIGLQPVPAIFEIVQNNLREVGLNPIGEILETAAFDQGQTRGDLGPVFMQFLGLQGFSAATLVDALPALRPNHPSKVTDPKYRELKDKLQAAQGDAYPAALQELSKYMLDEAFSHVLVHTRSVDVRRPGVKGSVYDNVGYIHFGTTWLEG